MLIIVRQTNYYHDINCPREVFKRFNQTPRLWSSDPSRDPNQATWTQYTPIVILDYSPSINSVKGMDPDEESSEALQLPP